MVKEQRNFVLKIKGIEITVYNSHSVSQVAVTIKPLIMTKLQTRDMK